MLSEIVVSLCYGKFTNKREDFVGDFLSFLLVDKMMTINNNHLVVGNKALESTSPNILLCSATVKSNIFVTNYQLCWNCYFWPLPWCKKFPIAATSFYIKTFPVSYINLVAIGCLVMFSIFPVLLCFTFRFVWKQFSWIQRRFVVFLEMDYFCRKILKEVFSRLLIKPLCWKHKNKDDTTF